jgi:hypothetical protein
MKRLPKMETIVEEIYITVKEPESLEEDIWTDWIEIWQGVQDWGQWSDIEYIDVYEPTSAPPPITWQ